MQRAFRQPREIGTSRSACPFAGLSLSGVFARRHSVRPVEVQQLCRMCLSLSRGVEAVDDRNAYDTDDVTVTLTASGDVSAHRLSFQRNR